MLGCEVASQSVTPHARQCVDATSCLPPPALKGLEVALSPDILHATPFVDTHTSCPSSPALEGQAIMPPSTGNEIACMQDLSKLMPDNSLLLEGLVNDKQQFASSTCSYNSLVESEVTLPPAFDSTSSCTSSYTPPPAHGCEVGLAGSKLLDNCEQPSFLDASFAGVVDSPPVTLHAMQFVFATASCLPSPALDDQEVALLQVTVHALQFVDAPTSSPSPPASD
jgi:hypothetical protein